MRKKMKRTKTMKNKFYNTIFNTLITLSVMLLLTCDTKKPSTEPDIPVIVYDLTLAYEVQTPDLSGTYQTVEDEISYADYGITRVKLTAQLKDEGGIFVSGQELIVTFDNLNAEIEAGNIELVDQSTDDGGKFRFIYNDEGQSGDIQMNVTYKDEYENTATASVTFTVLPLESVVKTLTLTTDETIVLLNDESEGAIYTTLFNAMVKDSSSIPVENLTVNFTNLGSIGALLNSSAITDSIGQCSVELLTNGTETGATTIKTFITIEELERISSESNGEIYFPELEELARSGETEISDTLTVLFQSQLEFYIDQIHSIEAWAGSPTINILEYQEYNDSLYARVSDIFGGPIPNIPITFQNNTPELGGLSNTVTNTNELGKAAVNFTTQPGVDEGLVELSVFINNELALGLDSASISILLTSEITPPEEEVDTLFIDASPDTTIILDAYPDSTYTVTITGIVKDEFGVAVEDVPVYFQNLNPAIGTLSNFLVFTDSLGRGVVTLSTNPENIGETTIKSFILNSTVSPPDTITQNSEDVLFLTEQQFRQLSVQNIYLINDEMEFTVSDLTTENCDTLYAVAQDGNGAGVDRVDVQFSLDNADLGYLSIGLSETDSTGKAQSTFCANPGNLNQTTITVSVPESEVDNKSITINFIDNLPTCSGYPVGLNLTSEFNSLPDPDTEVSSAVITATLTDTSGYCVEDNTEIEFDAYTDSSGVLIPFGSMVPPISFFQDGVATAEFIIGSDAGLATIIGKTNSSSESDTVYVNVNSTNANYIEILPIYPSEISLLGGGGTEATQITAEIRDSNGSLVTDSYNVAFVVECDYPIDGEGLCPVGDADASNDVSINGINRQTEMDTFMGDLDNWSKIWPQDTVESVNGSATVTLNSGNRPGSVRVTATLFDITDSTFIDPLSSAETIPLTILTGAPAFGQINYSFIDTDTIGAGLFQLPISISLWDQWTNPVSDCTNVYIWLDPDSTAFVDGEAKIGEVGPNGNAYPGVAWTHARYSSAALFAQGTIFAQTYDDDGNTFIISSDDNPVGYENTCAFCSIDMVASPTGIDFPCTPDGSTSDITVTATLWDPYMVPVPDGTLQLIVEGFDCFNVAENPLVTDENGVAEFTLTVDDSCCNVNDPEADPLSYTCEDLSIYVILLNPTGAVSDVQSIDLERHCP